jgi:putative flippase GtrA
MLKKLRQWGLAPAHSVLLQIPRALLASVICAVLDFGLLVLLVEQGGWNPVPAAVVGYLAGGVLQYVLCACWVFPAAPLKAATGFVAFTVLSLVGLGITWVTMATLHDLFHVNYALAKVVALGLAFSWNFLSRKFLLFRPGQPEHDATPPTGKLNLGFSVPSSPEVIIHE